jgi:Raf kinase inhibitor-like YbhB/YbcL family protein
MALTSRRGGAAARAAGLVLLGLALAPLLGACGDDGAGAGFRFAGVGLSDGGPVPSRDTCFGPSHSPGVAWRDPPAGTGAFALIIEDLDNLYDGGPFVHWLLYNVPGSATAVPEVPQEQAAHFASGGLQGWNSAARLGYYAICPSATPAVHRYRFTLSALDAPLVLLPGASHAQLTAAMRGHILGQAQMTVLDVAPGGGP